MHNDDRDDDHDDHYENGHDDHHHDHDDHDDFDEDLWFMLTVRMRPRHLGINLELDFVGLLGGQ